MPNPNLTAAFLIATLLGALFHLIVGGNGIRLLAFLLAAWLGFAMGNNLGHSSGLNLFIVGELHLLTASLGAIALLLITRLLTTNRRTPRPRRNP